MEQTNLKEEIKLRKEKTKAVRKSEMNKEILIII